MALSQREIMALAGELRRVGLPAGFEGDRLDAFRVGLSMALDALAVKVSIDKPKEEPKK